MVINVGAQTAKISSTKFSFNASSGTLSVTGDIIAYASDDRLKNRVSNIENAISKVNTLNGFYYTFNDEAEKLGYQTGVLNVGVSAQELLEVLPEAVKPAAANNEFYTVQYEKIVPLLIEAIKELNKKIENK
jgi:hypothetical protein